MTVVAFVLFVVAVATMVVAHRRALAELAEPQEKFDAALHELLERVDARLLERLKSMEKQGRALIREHERTRRKADEVLKGSQGLHRQVQQVLTDPKVQRVLNDG
jgi:molecular chaperone GrpE (heat shock protein)